ncbi:MAG: redoxin domain-containing protein [Bacteroidaceae bacterium]|nr:redoxin domain-containing protein [Bacteroidaceae bacterium]
MRKRKAQRTNQAIMRGVIAMALIVLLVCYMFLTMVSCSDGGPRVAVEGAITGAEDSTLVLEAVTLDGVQPLDSARLKADGAFAFTVPADSTAIPEFYRLRIGSQIINFAVDTLADITVEAPFARMSIDYDIEGNAASRTMKTISLLNIQLQRQLQALGAEASLSAMEKQERAQHLVRLYKQTLKADYILKAPGSAAAYFALFQTIGSQMLFNPESDRGDVQYFAAVATQWEQLYPHHRRTENLRNIALRGLRNTRPPRTIELQVDGDKVRESGIIDFGFDDIHGVERRLSDLHDNVVLLDFTAYSLPQSQQRIIEMRELYAAYHARGLEIYQVSLDADEHYWKTMCEQLPWVCVYCPEGVANDMVLLYGVQSLPTYFLIGRGSELQARGDQIPDLRKAIEAAL